MDMAILLIMMLFRVVLLVGLVFLLVILKLYWISKLVVSWFLEMVIVNILFFGIFMIFVFLSVFEKLLFGLSVLMKYFIL